MQFTFSVTRPARRRRIGACQSSTGGAAHDSVSDLIRGENFESPSAGERHSKGGQVNRGDEGSAGPSAAIEAKSQGLLEVDTRRWSEAPLPSSQLSGGGSGEPDRFRFPPRPALQARAEQRVSRVTGMRDFATILLAHAYRFYLNSLKKIYE